MSEATTGSFVERYGLWTGDQQEAAERVIRELELGKIEVVRFSIPDQHGLLRGKTLVVDEAKRALRNGVTITTTVFAKDTSHKTVFPVFSPGGGFDMPEMQGGADALMIADPSTFRVLPWAPHSAWVLCDAYFQNGQPVPFATRQLCRNILDRLRAKGFELIAGLEVEFHLFKLKDTQLQPAHVGQPGSPPDVLPISRGYQHLTELRYDSVEPLLEIIRRDITALNLPVRSLEVEFGPSQFEFTFGVTAGLATADNMVLFRNAVKQVCQRNGYHATFMARPGIEKSFSSGWHLHQSLKNVENGRNAFVASDAELSDVGRHYLAGLLNHARGATALSAPTINAYKRYVPYSLAPDRANWGRDNRGVMIRLIGGANDPATHLENRIGEPAANPYLYLGGQVLSGLDGMQERSNPGPSADSPYEQPAPLLPTSLSEALLCLSEDACMRVGLGEGFVRYFCKIKQAEIARFNAEVTAWEQREYFEMF